MHTRPKRAKSGDIQLNLAINRALFAKDVGKVLTLLSDWMDGNFLTLPNRFVLPRHLSVQLDRASTQERSSSDDERPKNSNVIRF